MIREKGLAYIYLKHAWGFPVCTESNWGLKGVNIRGRHYEG